MCIFFFTLYLLYHLLFSLKRTSARVLFILFTTFHLSSSLSSTSSPSRLLVSFYSHLPSEEGVPRAPILYHSSFFIVFFLTRSNINTHSSKHTCTQNSYRRSLARSRFFLFPKLRHVIHDLKRKKRKKKRREKRNGKEKKNSRPLSLFNTLAILKRRTRSRSIGTESSLRVHVLCV